MTILGAVAWGLAFLLTVGWVLMIRDGLARDSGVTPEVNNTGVLFVALLTLIPLFRLSGLHLLWLFPLAWFLGQHSRRFPLSLLEYPGAWFLWAITRGVRPR